MTDLLLLREIPGIRCVGGTGDYARGTGCVMSMAVGEWRLRQGESLGVATDDLPCVSQVVRTLAIYRNDTAADTAWALATYPRILDTTPERDVEVAAWLARYAVRVIAPEALDAAGMHDEAERLRALPEGVPLDQAADAAEAAWEAAAAAKAADAAARAARAAAREAWEAVEAAEAAAGAARAWEACPTYHLDHMLEAAIEMARRAER
jgi:hypothetical protein